MKKGPSLCDSPFFEISLINASERGAYRLGI